MANKVFAPKPRKNESKICNEAQADVIFFVSKDFYG